MGAPDHYWPQKGDVVLVRATISHITVPTDSLGVTPSNRLAADSRDLTGEIKLTGRTGSDRVARFGIDDIEKVEVFEMREGSRVRWWEDGTHSGGKPLTVAGYIYGEVLAVEPAEDEADRPHKDNLWIKVDGSWQRKTFKRDQVERA